MKYSKSDSEYFRNKKGGGLETNGKLNEANFSRSEIVELKEMNSSNNTTKIKPIKIMVKKKSIVKSLLRKLFDFDDEHYIFFGFNPETGTYEYVMYVNPEFAGYKLNSGFPIICKKREDNGTIVELTHKQFLNINIKELSVLIYNLLIIPRNSLSLDHTFFRYLLDFVLPHILKNYKRINNNNLHSIVNQIRKFLNIPQNNNNNNNTDLPKRS